MFKGNLFNHQSAMFVKATVKEVFVHLMASDADDPRGRNYESCMSTYWTGLLYLLEHEAGNLVVILKKGKTNQIDLWKSMKTILLRTSKDTFTLCMWK